MDWHELNESWLKSASLELGIMQSCGSSLIQAWVYRWIRVPELASPAADPAPWLARPSFGSTREVNE